MLEAIKMTAAIKSGFRVDGMTISFDVMIQQLKIHLKATHYIQKYRCFMTLDHAPQNDLAIMMHEKFGTEEFCSAYEFSKRISHHLDYDDKKTNGFHREALIPMSIILSYACLQIDCQEEKIKAEIESRILSAMIDDDNEEISQGL